MANVNVNKWKIRKGKPLPLGVTRDGKSINFAVSVPNDKECTLNIYKKGTDEIIEIIPLKKEDKIGNVYSVLLEGFEPKEYEYMYKIGEKEFLDPYAKIIHGRETFGKYLNKQQREFIRAGFVTEDFNWETDTPLCIKFSDLIIYKIHVRGFTKHTSSKVKNKGYFAGVVEKIPYLKELGINCIEFMPTNEFNEIEVDRRQQAMEEFVPNMAYKVNYWGYKSATSFFAPKASYAAGGIDGRQVEEFKEMIKELHKNGIEVILEFYFEERTNQELIIDCLRYWVLEYHVDGFHINTNGALNSFIAMDPILSKTKLLTNSWDINCIYNNDFIPVYKNLAEYNDSYMIDIRRFLKSDEGQVEKFTYRIKNNGLKQGIINYITNHNGFTLADLYSFDIKHNEMNGEGNRDGTEFNYSWNCGIEGKSKKKKIRELRIKQIKNAWVTLLFSQSVPMILSGDEIGASKNGNNNSYCQDNNISWINWKLLETNKEMFQFVKRLIQIRKDHPILHKDEELRIMDYLSCGSPDLSYHGVKAWYPDYSNYSRIIGVMLCGKYARKKRKDDDYFYIAFNMHWEEHEFDLPRLPMRQKWSILINTSNPIGTEINPDGEEVIVEGQKKFKVDPRTIVVFIGK